MTPGSDLNPPRRGEDGGVSEPRVNIDHFYHRPTGDVVGLLTDKSEIPAISADLESAGTDVRFGYAGTTLAIYDAALRDGDLLLHVPVHHADRQRIATLLQRHQAHDLSYLGPGTFEQFPDPG